MLGRTNPTNTSLAENQKTTAASKIPQEGVFVSTDYYAIVGSCWSLLLIAASRRYHLLVLIKIGSHRWQPNGGMSRKYIVSALSMALCMSSVNDA